MEKRPLGHSGLEVSNLTFGGNVLGWTADEPASFAILDAFVAAGGNFIDTADVYSRFAPGLEGGESETVLGKWVKAHGNRNQVIIATKVGSDMGPGGSGLSRKHILESIENSLRRLQTDFVDLYQSHKDDPTVPQEETLATYADLINQGKVRAIGASNFTAERLKEALEISKRQHYPRYESLQPLYNLLERAEYEQHLEPVCVQEGLGVIPYFSLAAGFLTGKYRSEQDAEGKARGMFVKKYMTPQGFQVLRVLDEIAQEYHTTPAQITLAWLLTRPSVTSPIVSATSVAQLNDIVKAADIKLDQAAVQRLNEVSDPEKLAK
ncbi:oxidoreductase [Ktedonobacteria bacterium brp13]|nr:oxidoreductase [Ktedonobacteria bacterium brp13]